MSSSSSELAESAVSQDWREVTAAELGSSLGLFAHDLRNPLAAMVSNLSYLRSCPDMDASELNEVVTDLELSVESLGRIIDHLGILGEDLGAARAPESGGGGELLDEQGREGAVFVSSAQLILGNALERLLPAVKRAAQSHEVTFFSSLGELSHLHLAVKEPHFSHALSALLHNAIALSPTRKDVRLSAHQDKQHLLLCIEDSGPVIDPQLKHQALSVLHQNQIKTVSRARYSRGMGLYAAARSAYCAGASFLVGQRREGESIRSQMVLRAPVYSES